MPLYKQFVQIFKAPALAGDRSIGRYFFLICLFGDLRFGRSVHLVCHACKQLTAHSAVLVKRADPDKSRNAERDTEQKHAHGHIYRQSKPKRGQTVSSRQQQSHAAPHVFRKPVFVIS